MSAFSRRYREALGRYLAAHDESALAAAYELGRAAQAEGAGLLEVLEAHRAAITDSEGAIGPAHEFLLEALAPFDMAHRGFRDAARTLRELNDRLESEIRRIAHALHDDVQQLLATVSIVLQDLSRELPAGQRERLGGALEQIDGIADHVRRLSHELRPTILDDLGLVPALEFLAAGAARRGDLRVQVVGSTEGRLGASTELALYRIAQEALNNILRHSRAREAEIGVESRDGLLRLTIRDDGVGFDVAAEARHLGDRGLGLLGMKERVEALGGTLKIASTPGDGTVVLVTVTRQHETGALTDEHSSVAG